MEKSAKPFPIKPFKTSNGVEIPKSEIPWWLAEIVYARIVTLHGRMPSLEQIAQQQGGFDAASFLDVMAGGTGLPPFGTFRAMVANKQRSIKDQVQIVVPGTREYTDAMREVASEAKDAAKARPQAFYASGPLGWVAK